MDETGTTSTELGLREAAVEVVRALVDAGHVAYFAGGCVRDRLMGSEPTDYDVATDATPDRIKALFRSGRFVGESFGVVLVRRGGHVFDVATFRSDGPYEDGRHPERVTFSDAEHDARRRDFTINGLFENPLEAKVIDFVGGEDDLAARRIRAIGVPADRIREDHLRMLRAVRFAARFMFEIEEQTAAAIREMADDLAGVSRERIGQEVKRMLSDVNRAVAAWEMQYLGLDATVLGEPSTTAAPTRLGRLPAEAAYTTALAAWLLDRHEGRAVDSDVAAARWSRQLMLSNAERAGLQACLDLHRTLSSRWAGLGVAKQKRLAVSPGFNAAMSLVQTSDRELFVDVCRRVEELSRDGLAPAPLIDGDDLIQCGLTPGPHFKRVLEAVYDAQLEGTVTDRDSALTLARVVAESD